MINHLALMYVGMMQSKRESRPPCRPSRLTNHALRKTQKTCKSTSHPKLSKRPSGTTRPLHQPLTRGNHYRLNHTCGLLSTSWSIVAPFHKRNECAMVTGPEHGIPDFISFMPALRARNPVFWPKWCIQNRGFRALYRAADIGRRRPARIDEWLR